MTQTYFAVLTAVGEAKDAAAKALGVPLVITQMAVGDANGVIPTPDRARTALIHEQRRAPLNALSIDPANPSQVIAEQVIPETVGGWWIYELGLYDADGDLIAYANCPPTYKPLLAEGSGRTQVVRMVLLVSSADTVQLKIDPAIVLATRKYADDAITASMNTHLAAADPHPQYVSHPELASFGIGTSQLPSISDNADFANPLKPSGIYRVTSTVTTHPAGFAAGTVIVMPYVAATGDPVQLYIGRGTPQRMLMRRYAAGAWSAWSELALTDSPALTGTPTAPTAAAGTSTTQIANTAFVQAAVAALVNSSPAALDTLKELASALGNDANFATTVTNALALRPAVYSIIALPATDVGPIIVAECSEVWTWVSTAYYTGYRSPLCGRRVSGHTLAPLASEFDAIGGLLPKTAYARVWGYAQENGLVVTQAVWTANKGAHYFVDVDATYMRVPDLRDMFERATGTDADTANARALGSRQLDAIKQHDHPVSGSGHTTGGGSLVTYLGLQSGGQRTGSVGGAETRSINTAYAPRIHA